MDFLKGIHFRHVVMPEQLREHYPLLEEGCTRAGGSFAPDVYMLIMQGTVDFIVGFRDGSPRGFFTCYPVEHPGEPATLHVWHGYIRPGEQSDGLLAAFAELRRVATARGCQRIAFRTKRKGWARVAKKLCLSLDSYTFVGGI